MKKILFLLLAVVMLFSSFACTSPTLEQTTETATTEEGTVATTGQTQQTSDDALKIPEGFCAGFARADITPNTFPFPLNSSANVTGVLHKIYINVVAVSDGDEVAFLIHMDLKGMYEPILTQSMKIVEQETGVPSKYVFFTATHNHSAPQVNGSDSKTALWQKSYYKQLRDAVKKAYRDLSPATMTGGIADTTGYAFVRRYICADGSLTGTNMAYPTGSPVVRHETEADPDLQVIRFTRPAEGKKDIIIANWQCHAAHAYSTYKVTSDFIHYFRSGVEGRYDAHFAYFNGASGNINLSTKFPELIKYNGSGWEDVGRALVGKLNEALAVATPLASGEIKVATGSVEGVYRVDDPERVKQAMEWKNATTTAAKNAVLAKYKFQSLYEAMWIANRAGYTTLSTPIPLSAIAFGDVGFAAAPYEMFDTNGMAVKQGSPYKMTFMCAYTNGVLSYMPDRAACERGGYEFHACNFEIGTAEKCEAELIRLLKNVQ